LGSDDRCKRLAVYAASKNAVRTITEGLRLESEGKYRVPGISPGFVETSFADSMTDSGVRAQIQKRMDEIALEPEAIARAMAFAIEQPDDVDVGDIIIRPTVQA
jgi:NADP-dependent 3-hydroxy acid dehydrogenase YdfG